MRKKEAKRSPYGPVKFTSVSEYHASFPKEIRSILDELRSIIKSAAPGAEEIISYNMPAFKRNRNVVYYAAHKAHIGFYPTATPLQVFAKDLEKYKTTKGAIQFPLDRPLPKMLIKRIVKFRVEEDERTK